jgi:cell wall assembly regulator SMI1
VTFYIEKAPKHKMFGLKKSWFKIEFTCGIDSYGGPYLYRSENSTSKDREVIEINLEDYENVAETIKELHELEKETYNWDELEFVVFADGKFEYERTHFDIDNQISFTSSPENTIKKKYFHLKWIPVFSDYGGNYIGIDLDPDTKGKKGQVIIFGRDEENMIVLADNLDLFFDNLLTEMAKSENGLLNSVNHIHNILRELKK